MNLNDFDSNGNVPKQGNPHLFSDIEVISLTITTGYLSLDSEHWFFNKINTDCKPSFPHLIHRSRYNRSKRPLFPMFEKIRQHLASRFIEFEDYFIIDYMPLEVCKISREKRWKVYKSVYETSQIRGLLGKWSLN